MNATRDFIIKNARELFLEKGYGSVTVQDICTACGITKTTFYYHLKSKEEIILNIYDSITKSLSEYMIEILSVDHYWEQLMILFESLAKESVRYGIDLQKQLFISNLKDDRGSYDFREDLTRIAVKLIERAQEAGQIRNQSPAEALYRTSAYAFLGYHLTWCMKGDQFKAFEQIRQAMEQIYDVAPELRTDPQQP
ncbi:MAG TPA: TetR/AcrR family transcriptional regulator [Anaerovoracaceae bacterium]|nr:TetR/AcrR family transcriptional regulator [Anaerovoracaceae bacterium]